MLKKNYSKSGNICRVTFKYNNSEGSTNAALVGEFNKWSLQENPMKKLKDGSFSITLSLQAGNSYQFRYVLDGNIWVNEVEADSYVTNQYGEENSVVTV
jgi:1,4-alpha-glucan branching enzyme